MLASFDMALPFPGSWIHSLSAALWSLFHASVGKQISDRINTVSRECTIKLMPDFINYYFCDIPFIVELKSNFHHGLSLG